MGDIFKEHFLSDGHVNATVICTKLTCIITFQSWHSNNDELGPINSSKQGETRRGSNRVVSKYREGRLLYRVLSASIFRIAQVEIE
jgi:hypothetical protein